MVAELVSSSAAVVVGPSPSLPLAPSSSCAMAMLDPAVVTAIAQAVAVAMQATSQNTSKNSHNALGGPPEWDSGKDEAGFTEWHVAR